MEIISIIINPYIYTQRQEQTWQMTVFDYCWYHMYLCSWRL